MALVLKNPEKNEFLFQESERVAYAALRRAADETGAKLWLAGGAVRDGIIEAGPPAG